MITKSQRSEAGRVLGQIGGKALFKKRGKKFMKKISAMGKESIKRNKSI